MLVAGMLVILVKFHSNTVAIKHSTWKMDCLQATKILMPIHEYMRRCDIVESIHEVISNLSTRIKMKVPLLI